MWLDKIILFVGFLTAFGQLVRSCTTPNGERAKCISIYSCPNLLRVIRTRDPEQTRFIRESQCGGSNQDQPLVCCGSSTNFKSINEDRRPRPRTTPTKRNNILPDRSQCGFQLSDKIYGGTATNFDEFPWMVLLQYRNRSGSYKFSCGGTLISSRYILTAAHCVTGAISTVVGKLVKVRLGEYNTDTEIDCVQRNQFNICNDKPLDIEIDETVVHPDYQESNVHRYHDIALIRLSKDVTFSDFIRPICLPNTNEQPLIGDKLSVSGWGRTSNTQSFSPVKLKVEVPLAQKSACLTTFRSAGIILGNGQICAGGEVGKDSCTGDSGGPLMATTKNDSSQWYIEGLVSFGARCGTAGWPAVYTKVSEYTNWIHDTVRK